MKSNFQSHFAHKSVIGQRIHAIRNRQHATQFVFASFLAISCSQLSNIERGHSFPSLRVLSNLSAIYHCSINSIINF
jgi:transcriptional regulator with XRE-family HTH domain